MSVSAISRGGARYVVLDLDARTMLDVWFHLHASRLAEETTTASRIHVAGLLAPLERALVASGVITEQAARDLRRHMDGKPQPPPLDTRVPFWQRES